MFSIVMPTRNRPGDFSRALASVCAQTCQDFEVIVVDDGSSDETRAQYDQIALTSAPKVRVLRLMQRTRGHGHCFARNHGIEAAKGQYIGFLDDDDFWTDPDFLRRARDNLLKHDADVYFANQQAISHDGHEVPGLWLSRLRDRLPNSVRRIGPVYPVTIDQLLMVGGFAHMNCWLVRKALFLAAGGMDESLRYEPDYDIYMRVLDQAAKVLHDEHVVSRHHVPDPSRQNNASTANGRVQKLLYQLMVVEKHLLFLQHPQLLSRTRIRKGYILKRMAKALAMDGQYRNASHYARLGLVSLPTLRWFFWATWLTVRSPFSARAHTPDHRR
jgi:glycosyltransferase involved in cell wall biosynthesis